MCVLEGSLDIELCHAVDWTFHARGTVTVIAIAYLYIIIICADKVSDVTSYAESIIL